jgi:hypothetical protein
VNEIIIGSGQYQWQKIRLIRVVLDTQEDFPVDALVAGMPVLTGLRGYCLGLQYDYNGTHQITFKSNTPGTPTTIRDYKRNRDVQYSIEEPLSIFDGKPSKILFATLPGEDLLVRMPTGQIAAAGGSVEINLAICYGANLL